MIESLRPQSDGKRVGAVIVRVDNWKASNVNVVKPLPGEGLGITVISACGDLGTTCNGIPRSVGPLDTGLKAHGDLLESSNFNYRTNTETKTESQYVRMTYA